MTEVDDSSSLPHPKERHPIPGTQGQLFRAAVLPKGVRLTPGFQTAGEPQKLLPGALAGCSEQS